MLLNLILLKPQAMFKRFQKLYYLLMNPELTKDMQLIKPLL